VRLKKQPAAVASGISVVGCRLAPLDHLIGGIGGVLAVDSSAKRHYNAALA